MSVNTEYIDVVLVGPLGNLAEVWHVAPGVVANLEPGTYELVREASGKNCLVASAKFGLRFDEQGGVVSPGVRNSPQSHC